MTLIDYQHHISCLPHSHCLQYSPMMSQAPDIPRRPLDQKAQFVKCVVDTQPTHAMGSSSESESNSGSSDATTLRGGTLPSGWAHDASPPSRRSRSRSHGRHARGHPGQHVRGCKLNPAARHGHSLLATRVTLATAAAEEQAARPVAATHAAGTLRLAAATAAQAAPHATPHRVGVRPRVLRPASPPHDEMPFFELPSKYTPGRQPSAAACVCCCDCQGLGC